MAANSKVKEHTDARVVKAFSNVIMIVSGFEMTAKSTNSNREYQAHSARSANRLPQI
jgi:hypothetical protein